MTHAKAHVARPETGRVGHVPETLGTRVTVTGARSPDTDLRRIFFRARRGLIIAVLRRCSILR